MSKRLILILLSFFGMAQIMPTCTVDTNVIGRMPMTFNNAPTNTSRLSGLFLNTKYRSPCNGTVTAWDFCYYISVTHTSNITIQAGVWRESSENYLTLVNNSLIKLPIPDPQPGFQFVCRHWALNQSQDEPLFEVQERDIVGMYVNDISDENMVHILGMPPDGAEQNNTMKSMDITDIENPVSKSDLNPVAYSLYLVAVLGDGNETTTCPPTTDMPTTETATTPPIPLWTIAVIGVLGVIVLVLTIMSVAVICILCHLNRIKGSGPVLITRTKHYKRTAHIVKGPASSSTQLNGNSENTSCELSQQNTRSQPPLNPSPLSNMAELLTAPDQGVASSLSDTQSPPPVIFAIAFDDDQQARDGQDEPTMKQPNLCRKDAHTKAQRVALLPKLDLRRSRSAAEAMNLFHTNTAQTTDDLFTSSSEYPYVVHSFEAEGKDQGFVGSLPNMLQFARNNPIHNLSFKHKQEDCGDENTSTGVDDADTDDEPVYSYADRRDLMQNGTISVLSGTDNDFHYEEYPSDWMHEAKYLTKTTTDCNIYDDCQSPDYQDIDDYQNIDEPSPTKTESKLTFQSSNHTSPPKQSSVKDTLPLKSKPKPPVQPRKKLAQTIVPSNQATRPSRSAVDHQSGTDNTRDSDNFTSNKYMKLLSSTRDNFHLYTRLPNGIVDVHLEHADPNQSSEN